MKVLVIGSGLFGSIISTGLRRLGGHEVTVVDQPGAQNASRAAGCLMKPSWASSMGPAGYDEAIRLLYNLYDVRELTLEVWAGVKVSTTRAHWVDPRTVLVTPDWPGRLKGSLLPIGYDAHIVATGAVRPTFVPHELAQCVSPLGGWSFTWPGSLGRPPFISPWAPYKQVVGLDFGDKTWVGDGTALKPDSMTAERRDQSLERCAKAVGRHPGDATIQEGFRPTVRGLQKPAFLQRFAPMAWYATGGAKNGTLGAAWCTARLLEALQ